MTTKTADYQSEGILKRASGKFTGAGAAVDVSIGFTPHTVRVVNATDRITDEKYTGMASTEVIHTVANGIRTLDTNSLIVFKDPSVDLMRGFKIDAAAAINSKVIYWEAIG